MREGEGTPVPYSYSKNPVDEIFALPVFTQEELTPELIAEITPLLQAHYNEVAGDKDIPLNPRWDKYFDIQKAGGLLVYTARDEGRLIGYNAFLVDWALHYATALIGANDVIFIDPGERGFGRKFIAWCMERLQAIGVTLNVYHVKLSHNWGHILAELGFEPRETIWVKRLDK